MTCAFIFLKFIINVHVFEMLKRNYAHFLRIIVFSNYFLEYFNHDYQIL